MRRRSWFMTLVNEVKSASQHTVSWDAANVPSGVYYSRLSTGHGTHVRKLVLAK
jgi:hypothetical protein